MHTDSRCDEDLLIAIRCGDNVAETTLWERYFPSRFLLCNSIALDISKHMDEWEKNEVFFRAMCQSISGYKFCQVRFRTYFNRVLRIEMVRLAQEKIKDSFNCDVVRIDDTMASDTDSLLRDAIVSGTEIDDPKAYLQYMERLEALHRLPKGINPIAMKLIRHLENGYKIEEAAELCGVTSNKARYILYRFRLAYNKSMNLAKSHLKKKKNKD